MVAKYALIVANIIKLFIYKLGCNTSKILLSDATYIKVKNIDCKKSILCINYLTENLQLRIF